VLFASIGFSVDAITWYLLLNTGQQFLSHSNATQLLPLERLGLVTAAGHRIHHGIEPRYHNSNFGELLNIWDRLFGTYIPPTQHLLQIPIGVEDDQQRYNDPLLPMALCLQAAGWLRMIGARHN
jgi:sterol desaturase/sphingolipid hydroxylase (fatty acid hydroxylase superfamily)